MVAHKLLKDIGIETKYFKLIINSLGSQEDQLNYSKLLIDYLSQYKSKLSETSLSRLEKNPMRILDSKDDQDKEILINDKSNTDLVSFPEISISSSSFKSLTTIGFKLPGSNPALSTKNLSPPYFRNNSSAI